MHPRAALLVIVLSLSLAALGTVSTARADVVGPKPSFYLPGKVAVSDHSGSRCEDAAPTDCPSGWRGEIGGACRVASCGSGGSCEAGQGCTDAMVCVEKREILDRRHGPGGPPTFYDRELGICGPDAACDPPRRCVKSAVCVRAGETPTAYVPPPGQDEPTGLPRRGGGGCGGCAAGNEKEGAPATFLLGAALLHGMARRRRLRWSPRIAPLEPSDRSVDPSDRSAEPVGSLRRTRRIAPRDLLG